MTLQVNDIVVLSSHNMGMTHAYKVKYVYSQSQIGVAYSLCRKVVRRSIVLNVARKERNPECKECYKRLAIEVKE